MFARWRLVSLNAGFGYPKLDGRRTKRITGSLNAVPGVDPEETFTPIGSIAVPFSLSPPKKRTTMEPMGKP